MGSYVNDGYEAEFAVAKPLDEVWDALQVEADGQPLWLTAWSRMPDFEHTGVVRESEPQGRILVLKDSEPCKDSTIELRLDSTAQGTHVWLRQDNIPGWAKASAEVFTLGGDQIAADLALYLERGVLLSRHMMRWAFPGMLCREVATGLEVTYVQPGMLAARLGLERGDLLTTFGGAPLFTQHCLQTVLRTIDAGTTVEATWVRGTEVMAGDAEA